MSILKTLARSFKKLSNRHDSSAICSKERPKGGGEEMVKFVVFLKHLLSAFSLQLDNASQQVLFTVES